MISLSLSNLRKELLISLVCLVNQVQYVGERSSVKLGWKAETVWGLFDMQTINTDSLWRGWIWKFQWTVWGLFDIQTINFLWRGWMWKFQWTIWSFFRRFPIIQWCWLRSLPIGTLTRWWNVEHFWQPRNRPVVGIKKDKLLEMTVQCPKQWQSLGRSEAGSEGADPGTMSTQRSIGRCPLR